MARAKKLRKQSLNNVVVVSDLHAGCRLGLCPDTGAGMYDGGTYMPSLPQQKVWEWWNEFWNDWVPRVTHGEPYAVVVNGDALEGMHHKAKSTFSNNFRDQGELCKQILRPIVQKCEGRFYMVTGTPAHVGEQGENEEEVARHLEAKPNEFGQHARYEIWMRCGNGLIHFNHHIGTTASSHHETSAVNAELGTAFVEAGRWGNEPPDVIVRSHRHRCSEVRLPSKKGYAIAFVTPAWQLKTPFLFKVAGGRMTLPQIGGSLIRMGDEELHTRHWVKDFKRDKEEVMHVE